MGNAQGIYELGVLYYTGVGVPEDAKKAYELFELAAAMEHTAAQYMVADHLLGEGEGVVEEDPAAGIR